MRSISLISTVGLGVLFIFSMAGPGHTLCLAAKDLNGVWRANDGGTYYIRQDGNDVRWLGMSKNNGATFTNVFKGVKNGATIVGEWFDVPKGRMRSSGVLHLSIQGSTTVLGFTRTHATGGFGGSQWWQLSTPE